jgi:glycosyltransferase involved in cell wall biosynthesis
MKLVVFAHTPPPHHGQSFMVESMLRGFDDPKYDVQCFHVNAQFARDSKDIGKFRPGKAFRLVRYVAQAIWLRFRHGAVSFYYVPTPPLKNPLYRDWVILLLCKPFFHHIILHWHAVGLGEWIQKQPVWMQRMSRLALAHADLSISLARYNVADAARFSPQRSVLVPNGIPDPCPNFEEVRRARQERLRERLAIWNGPAAAADQQIKTVPVKVVYLGLCSKEKGLLDAVNGVCQANRLCKSNRVPLEFQLAIAGPFLDSAHEGLFRETMAGLGNPETIRHVGFVSGEEKKKLLAEMDILCFPTYYYAESFGLVIIEAMAFGAPVLATKWRSTPDLFPENYPGLVDIQSPDQIASALFLLAARDDADEFRRRYLENYTDEKFLENLSKAFHETATR